MLEYGIEFQSISASIWKDFSPFVPSTGRFHLGICRLPTWCTLCTRSKSVQRFQIKFLPMYSLPRAKYTRLNFTFPGLYLSPGVWKQPLFRFLMASIPLKLPPPLIGFPTPHSWPTQTHLDQIANCHQRLAHTPPLVLPLQRSHFHPTSTVSRGFKPLIPSLEV